MSMTRRWQKELNEADARPVASAAPSTRCGLVITIRREGMVCRYPLPPGVQPRREYTYKGHEWTFAGIVADDAESTVTA